MGATAPIYDYATSDRGLTGCVWHGLLDAYAKRDPYFGSSVLADPDFREAVVANTTDATAVSNWFIQDATAGGTVESLVATASPDGIRTLSATTGTDHFGIEMHYGTTATSLGVINLPSHSSAPRGTVVVEWRVDLNTLDQFVVGLTEPIVEFLGATSALPTGSDYIVFFRADDGALRLCLANDNNGGTAVTSEVTLLTEAEMEALEDTTNWCKLALRVNKDLSVEAAVNGVYKPVCAQLDPDALPIESLTFKLGIYRGPTSDAGTVALPIDSIHDFTSNLG